MIVSLFCITNTVVSFIYSNGYSTKAVFGCKIQRLMLKLIKSFDFFYCFNNMNIANVLPAVKKKY